MLRLPPLMKVSLQVFLLKLALDLRNCSPVAGRNILHDRRTDFGRHKNFYNLEFNITKRTDYRNRHGVLNDLLRRRVDVELGC
jgi:hypothetical protein